MLKIKQVNKITAIDLAKKAAHDLRSPIMAINLLVSNMKFESEKHRKLMQGTLVRINSISEEFLSVVKESNLEEIHARKKPTTSLQVLLENLMIEKSILFGSKAQIDFYMTYDLYICHDIGQKIVRVISNLIDNSIDAFSDHVSLSVEANVVERKIIFVVSDNGTGIPQYLVQRMKNLETTTKQHGHGIGLSSSEKWVRSLGGELTVQTLFGLGTKIQIHLPF